MKIIKGKKKPQRAKRDAKKDSIFRVLSGLLADAGYQVRREKLKQGAGWRVMSGGCKAFDQAMIFVDSRLDQDEQISFLVARIAQLGVKLEEEQLSELPTRLKAQLLSAQEVDVSDAA